MLNVNDMFSLACPLNLIMFLKAWIIQNILTV